MLSYPFSFLFLTNRPDVAAEAEAAGIDWIFIDFEQLGKQERQRGRVTIISDHRVADIEAVRARLAGGARVLARVNPWHAGSPSEIEDVIAAGAQAVMLPMFTAPEEVGAFVDAVGGRALVWPLMETAAAVVRAEEIVAIRGVDRLHVGLNDLHLSLGLNFMHESLAGGIVERVARLCACSPGRPVFGFGGSARVGEQHPVPPSDVLREHVRLGSHAIIVSRTFHKDPANVAELQARMNLADEVCRIRAVLDAAAHRTAEEAERDRARIHETIRCVARRLRAGAS